MADSAAWLVDEVLPHRPMRQWVLSMPFPLRYLLASQPVVLGKVLAIVYRVIATHLAHKAGYTKTSAQAGALNLNIHFHRLFLDAVYARHGLRFRRVNAPSGNELTRLTHTIARRIGRYLERQGLLERDAGHSYLCLDTEAEGPMEHLLGSSITYRIAMGPQQGRKVFS